MGYQIGRCLIRQRLKEYGLKQVDLVKRTGYTRSFISDLVNERQTASLATAFTLAEAIGCHVRDLYELIWIKPPDRYR